MAFETLVKMLGGGLNWGYFTPHIGGKIGGKNAALRPGRGTAFLVVRCRNFEEISRIFFQNLV